MKFLIDNIVAFSLLLVMLIQLAYWIFDKIKIKKDILDIQDSICRLRKTNHDIRNTMHHINLKLAADENDNKAD